MTCKYREIRWQNVNSCLNRRCQPSISPGGVVNSIKSNMTLRDDYGLVSLAKSVTIS